MTDKTWTVMNDLTDAFNLITHYGFLIDKLNDGLNKGDLESASDAAKALATFHPVYISNWDEKFAVAWNHVVKSEE